MHVKRLEKIANSMATCTKNSLNELLIIYTIHK